jgi:tRNA-dihydrouridine synthase B
MTDKTFWRNLSKPIIGLAPMEGYSDSAFRRVCKTVNPSIITITEFTSADGLFYNSKSVEKKLWFHPSENPLIAQIFGKDTETFIAAAKRCEALGFTGIDINMGCPAKKVVRSEHGVALRRNLDLAFSLIETLANNTSLPVSVKTRLGWSDADDLITFGKGSESAGADMICIHARTYQNPYNVPAQWEPVYELKKNVSIPVLGNGGITSYEDGLNKLGNLDGFLIGQASFGNPWIFDATASKRTFKEKIPLIMNHAEWLIEHKGLTVGSREIRKHLVQYVKGIPGARAFRSQLVRVTSLSDIYQILTDIDSHTLG